MSDNFYLDEDCVVSFFIGEFGWFLQRFQGRMRYFAKDVYPERKMIIFTDMQNSVFLNDFVYATIELPKWFYDLNLDRDCYEAVDVNSPAGSLTDPKVYAKLIEYVRSFYNRDKSKELFPPRGCNYIWENRPQIFCKYKTDKIEHTRPIIVVFPRARVRAANRNVPEYVWLELVNRIKLDMDVVLAGTLNGACLQDYESEGVINLIKYNEPDKTEKIIQYLNNCVCSISSQSGGTHLSLLSGANTYIIGHEKERHTVQENRLNVPASFRVLQDYRAIDSDTIISDVNGFLNRLNQAGYFNNKVIMNRPSLETLRDKKDLVGAEIGVFKGDNSLNILENLDIKKLYLIDPYDTSKKIAGINIKDSNELIEYAKNNLLNYKNKTEFIYKHSKDAVDSIKDNELDFVYIDGDHTYEGAKLDIELYYNKVKDGGMIAGHDYENEGVTKAVHEFFGEKNIKVYSGVDRQDSRTNDWWCYKPIVNDTIINNDINLLNEIIQERINE